MTTPPVIGVNIFLFVSLYFSNLGHNPFNGHSLLSSQNFFLPFVLFFAMCCEMIITYAKWFKKWRIINYNELKRIHLESLLILIRIISWLLRKLKSIFIFHFLGDNSSNEKKFQMVFEQNNRHTWCKCSSSTRKIEENPSSTNLLTHF